MGKVWLVTGLGAAAQKVQQANISSGGEGCMPTLCACAPMPGRAALAHINPMVAPMSGDYASHYLASTPPTLPSADDACPHFVLSKTGKNVAVLWKNKAISLENYAHAYVYRVRAKAIWWVLSFDMPRASRAGAGGNRARGGRWLSVERP